MDKVKHSILGQSYVDELKIIEEKLFEQFKISKENGEYLSTIQEYLIVSIIECFFITMILKLIAFLFEWSMNLLNSFNICQK